MKTKWLEPKGITAIIVMIAALSGAIVIGATYINLPKDVAAMGEDVYDIKAYINEQRIANKLMQDMQQKTIYKTPKQEPYCEWENDEKWCYDEKYKEWWRAL